MQQKKLSIRNILLEIFIVIVGISIAFWLNNWGEKRKQNNLEMEFLKSLNSELSIDSASFQYQIVNNEVNLNHISQFVEICQQKDFSNDSLQWLVGNFLNRNNWLLNTNTYDMLKSGGNLDIISDFEIRSEVSAFYHLRGFQSERVLGIIQDFLDNQMHPYLIANTDFHIASKPSLDFVRDREFQNLLVLWRDLTEAKLSIYEGTLEEIGDLMSKLAVHLEE